MNPLTRGPRARGRSPREETGVSSSRPAGRRWLAGRAVPPLGTVSRRQRSGRLLALVLGAAALLAVARPVLAQPEPQPEPSLTEQLQERIRIMRAWRLTEVLDLDEVTAVQLFEHLDHYDTLIQPEQVRLNELGQRLRVLLEEGTGTDAEVAELVTQITETYLRIEQLNVERVREAGAFLDPRQQAALMLFLPEFDREIRQMVRQVRSRRARREGVRRVRDGAAAEPGDDEQMMPLLGPQLQGDPFVDQEEPDRAIRRQRRRHERRSGAARQLDDPFNPYVGESPAGQGDEGDASGPDEGDDGD